MDHERTEKTEAFDKYIDAIFIIQNELMFVTPRTSDKRIDVRYGWKLDTYQDEKNLRSGMCVELAERIGEMLNYERTKEIFKKEMLKLASNFDIDYVEMTTKRDKLERTLLAHAKLQYCFDNYILDSVCENDISILSCLISLYAVAVKIKNEKQKNYECKIKDVYRSKWYKYVREAMLEEQGFDIKQYSKLSLQELSEALFDLIVEREYFYENSTTESMLSAEGTTIHLDIFVDEEDNSFEEYKNRKVQEVWDWVEQEDHKWSL